nr:hypothetical protein [Streptomyces sp. I6]
MYVFEPVTVVPSELTPATRSVCWSVIAHCFTVPLSIAWRAPAGVRVKRFVPSLTRLLEPPS